MCIRDRLISTNEAENRKLEKIRDALLPKLMSGEIDVSKVNLTQLNSHLADKLHRFAKEPSIVSSAQFVAQCVANWQGQAEMMNRTYAIQVRTPISRGKTSGSAY